MAQNSKLQKSKISPQKWIKNLKNTPLFQNLSKEELEEVVDFTEVKLYEVEAVVFQEGDIGDTIFIQLDGESVLYVGDKNNPTVLSNGSQGDCFGEMAVLEKEPRCASLKTTKPSHFLIINQSNFEKFGLKHPSFILNLTRFLSKRIRSTDRLLIDTLQTKNKELQETLGILEKTQKDLLQKERLSTLGRMASLIIYDLKNPLTSISHLAYVLHQDISDKQRMHYSELLKNEVNHLVELIEEIVLFASEQKALYLKETNLNELLDKLSSSVKAIMVPYPITLKVNSSVNKNYRLDSDKIFRCLLNICKNSWQALQEVKRENPTITILVEENENNLEFTISDNGTGISEDVKDNFFDAFVTTRPKKGSGLGLAVVKKIVEDHQGKITWSSSAEKGTSFTIKISRQIKLSS